MNCQRQYEKRLSDTCTNLFKGILTNKKKYFLAFYKYRSYLTCRITRNSGILRSCVGAVFESWPNAVSKLNTLNKVHTAPISGAWLRAQNRRY